MQHLIREMETLNRQAESVNRRMLAVLADAMRTLDVDEGKWMRALAQLCEPEGRKP